MIFATMGLLFSFSLWKESLVQVSESEDMTLVLNSAQRSCVILGKLVNAVPPFTHLYMCLDILVVVVCKRILFK